MPFFTICSSLHGAFGLPKALQAARAVLRLEGAALHRASAEDYPPAKLRMPCNLSAQCSMRRSMECAPPQNVRPQSEGLCLHYIFLSHV
jgi:hypothetical protein